jgi:hypothetical protein
MPRIVRKEPAIKDELAGGTLSDSEFERMLALASGKERGCLPAGVTYPDDMELCTKPNSVVGDIDEERRHEDEQ